MNIYSHTPLDGAILVDSKDRAATACGLDGSIWTLTWGINVYNKPFIEARVAGFVGVQATAAEYAGSTAFVPDDGFAAAFAVAGATSVHLSGPALVDWLVDQMLTAASLDPQIRELRNTLLDAAAICRKGEMTPAVCVEVFERAARLVAQMGRRP